uniref:Uncharacterized protein n=1 Tax=Rhizophora mucronata TaxID=61149 RepID=A0A2P2PU93_RHIMU
MSFNSCFCLALSTWEKICLLSIRIHFSPMVV